MAQEHKNGRNFCPNPDNCRFGLGRRRRDTGRPENFSDARRIRHQRNNRRYRAKYLGAYRQFHLVPTETITAQIQAIREDFDIRAYKIGMLGTAEIIECVADNLKHCSFGRRVLDPVMIAKGGAPLLQDSPLQH